MQTVTQTGVQGSHQEFTGSHGKQPQITVSLIFQIKNK